MKEREKNCTHVRVCESNAMYVVVKLGYKAASLFFLFVASNIKAQAFETSKSVISFHFIVHITNQQKTNKPKMFKVS